jgi:endonuclease/exonuclease/phosphatase (EEP) superfamily protein YafD
MAEDGWRHVARSATAIAFTTVMFATLLSVGARLWWVCDLFTHFRPQLALGCLLTGVAGSWLRARSLAWAAAAGLVLNVFLMAPVVWPTPATVLADGRPVRVVSFNVAFFNRDFAALGPYLESLHADVIALQEMPPERLPALLASLPGYPHRFLDANRDEYGVVVMSRWPLGTARAVDLGVPGRPAARVSVEFPDARLDLTAVHLMWPIGADVSRQRNRQLIALARVARDCRGPCVMVGDFNVTRWSPRFQDLLRESGLRDGAQGLFVPQTWPSWPLPLRIRIDQCLVNRAVEVDQLAVGPTAGSDHLATINDLRIEKQR